MKYLNQEPSERVRELSLNKVLEFAYRLLNNKELDEDLQLYAAALLEALRIRSTETWRS